MNPKFSTPIAHLAPMAAVLLAMVAAAVPVSGQPDSLRWNEFRPRVMTDFGHVVRGDYQDAELEFQALNRNTVILEQSGAYGEDWTFDAGFKAIMWWPFPPANQPHERTIRVEPRLSQAKAKRRLGEAAFLEFGFFPYKYNPDARNLGEYLYRSGTYPGTVRTTDGFHLMNYAVFEAYGAHARWSQFDGLLQHDFNMFTEVTTIPIGDLTPAYEISVNLPLVQLGAGAAYNRLISFDPDRVRPRVKENGYYRVDSANGNGVEYEGPYALAPAFPSTVQTRIGNGDSTAHALHYYTQRGVKLMARAAVDLGPLVLPDHLRRPGDLRVYAEAALLGWENQPFYYEDRAERIPVMLGVNVPTLGLLDLLSVQAEYYPSHFASSYDYNYYSLPIWTVLPGYDPAEFERDDWKWSINASKTLNRLLIAHVQVANDHLRLPEFNANLSGTPLTQVPGNWYYLLRLESRF